MKKSKKKSKSSKRQPKTARALLTRELILEAATRILLSEGMEAVITNRIAEKAGISIGTLYQYYRNKEEILRELLEISVEKRVSRIKEALELRDLAAPDEVLVAKVVEALFQADRPEDIELEVHLFPYVALGKPELSKETMLKVDGTLRPLLKAALAIRFPKLITRNLDTIVFMLAQAVRGNVIGLTILKEERKDLEDLKRELVRMLLAYLRA